MIRFFATIAVLLATTAATWVGTWEAAPAWADPARSFTDTTLREVVHVSVGGALVRVRLSNAFGTKPLAIGDATVAVRAHDAQPAAAPAQLTFDGERTVLIPAGAQLISDPVALNVAAGSDLLVSIYVPGPTGPPTTHVMALQTNYFASGDRAADASGAAFAPLPSPQKWFLLSGVDVAQTTARGAVVTFGDSITDGWHSKVDENGRWPDELARRLAQADPAHPLAVLNAGISGNRLLLDGGHSGINALARFDRDVLGQSGVKDVIVLLGINDIQGKPQQHDPKAIETALLQIAQRAHDHGLRVLACTIMPVKPDRAYSPRVEAVRQAVNAFIRSSSAFDGVIDFDAAVRDPHDPRRLLPAYDSGDHLHPNSAGLKAMGDAIDLSKL